MTPNTPTGTDQYLSFPHSDNIENSTHTSNFSRFQNNPSANSALSSAHTRTMGFPTRSSSQSSSSVIRQEELPSPAISPSIKNKSKPRLALRLTRMDIALSTATTKRSVHSSLKDGKPISPPTSSPSEDSFSYQPTLKLYMTNTTLSTTPQTEHPIRSNLKDRIPSHPPLSKLYLHKDRLSTTPMTGDPIKASKEMLRRGGKLDRKTKTLQSCRVKGRVEKKTVTKKVG